jgi:hypothetical protein
MHFRPVASPFFSCASQVSPDRDQCAALCPFSLASPTIFSAFSQKCGTKDGHFPVPSSKNIVFAESVEEKIFSGAIDDHLTLRRLYETTTFQFICTRSFEKDARQGK